MTLSTTEGTERRIVHRITLQRSYSPTPPRLVASPTNSANLSLITYRLSLSPRLHAPSRIDRAPFILQGYRMKLLTPVS